MVKRVRECIDSAFSSSLPHTLSLCLSLSVSLLLVFSLANIDFIQASSAGCVTETGYYRKLIVATLAPLGMLLACVLFYFLPRKFLIRRAGHEQMDERNQMKRTRRNYW